MEQARWPNGYHCPRCEATAYCMVLTNGRPLFQCSACGRQTSLTAGSLFENTKLPLTTWFLAIYLLSQAKTGLSTLALKRQVGVSYPTAWMLHHKIMHAMAARDAVHQLGGSVQVDDAYLGGERAGGKVGRGSENKVPILAAVSLNTEGHPRYLKLSRIAGFTSEAVNQWAKTNLKPGSSVASDGLACFAALVDTTLSGAYKAFKYGKYAGSYLGAFAYRFNRRFDLRDLVVRLIVDVARCEARSRTVIRQAETHF